MSDLIPRIKEIRKKLHLTQAELSEFLKKNNLNISRGTIAKYESGVIYPSKATLNNLAKALDTTPFYLGGNGPTEENLDNVLLDLLQDSYFKSEDHQDQLHLQIKNWINATYDITNNKKMLPNDPYDLYKSSTGEIPSYNRNFSRFPAIDELWKTRCPFLFEDTEFRNKLIGVTDDELKELVIAKFKSEYSKRKRADNLVNLASLVSGIKNEITSAIYRLNTKEGSLEEVIDLTKKASHQLDLLARDLENSKK